MTGTAIGRHGRERRSWGDRGTVLFAEKNTSNPAKQEEAESRLLLIGRPITTITQNQVPVKNNCQEFPLNHYSAFVQALVLAITAPSDQQASQALALAEAFASSLTPQQVENAKNQVLMNLKKDHN